MTPLNVAAYLEQLFTADLVAARCSQVWLGYGETLFVGFGRITSSAASNEPHHPIPPYEIHTNHADWAVRVDGNVRVSNADDRTTAMGAKALLEGLYVHDWFFDCSELSLMVEFDNHTFLTITPWNTLTTGPNDVAWWLRTPSGAHVVATVSRSLVFEATGT